MRSSQVGRRLLGLGWLLVAMWCLGGCAGLIQGAATTLLLQRGDVPSGFDTTGPTTYTNAAVAQALGVPVTRVDGPMGRLRGARIIFDRPATPATLADGPVQVVSVASLYRGAVPASAAMAMEVRANAAAHGSAKSLRVGKVGAADHAVTWTEEDPTTHVVLRFTIVYWRDRNVLGAVSVAGLDGTFQTRDVMHLASLQEARMRAAP